MSNWHVASKPTDDRWVEVWHHTVSCKAKWIDSKWLDEQGKRLLHITHWRELMIAPTPPQYPPKTGTELVHEELAALREQVAQLTQRVQALEQPQRFPPVSVVSVFDWED